MKTAADFMVEFPALRPDDRITKARQILRSNEWKSLNNQLKDYVHNYSQKVVVARNGFQF